MACDGSGPGEDFARAVTEYGTMPTSTGCSTRSPVQMGLYHPRLGN
jgi:hypothetical protein